ncbi:MULTISPECIES: hypothetical protein [Bacillus]|uniref:hypothetical protein n=1 Tax=Bacillus TaxID=1386 RepID=UPI000B4AE14C|nr:hypothetical protein [Bacillus sp. S0635]MCP1285241.1 hypothetical protein [Bacillus sp. S0635]
MELNLQEKTDLILKKAHSEDYIKNPFCVGISENSLNFLSRNFSDVVYTFPVEEIEGIEMKIYGYDGLPFRDMLLPCLFKIDPVNYLVSLSMNLRIEFYELNEPFKPFAIANFIVKSKVEPFMGTSHKNFFSFNVDEVELDGTVSYPILDADVVTDKFGSVSKFEDHVNDIVKKISKVHEKSDFSDIVPSVFIVTEFPYVWRHVEGFEVRFERFYYEGGNILDEPCGYLFIMFSLESLRVLPPCNCPSSLKDMNSNSLTGKRINLNEFKDEDICITVGISEAAIREIFYPFTTVTKRANYSTSVGKNIVTGEASYWVEFKTKNIGIYLDSIGIDFEFKAGGSALAFVKDPLTHTEGKHKAADILFTIENISAQAVVSSKYNQAEKRNDMYIKPHVEISRPNVEIEGSAIPFPLSEVAELLIEKATKNGINAIKDKINNNMTFSLFPSRNARIPGVHLIFEGVDFYSDSSVVISALAMDD